MDKKLGKKIARSWGKPTKRKKIANKGVRANFKLQLKRG